MKYKFIKDLTSDVLYEAYGKDLKELFANSAEALMSIICQLDKIEDKESKEFEVKGDDLKDLMFNWLQELIASVDLDQLFYNRFEILEIDENHLKAKAYGEPISKEKGETVVKSVTYYKFNVEKTEKGYKASVSLDI